MKEVVKIYISDTFNANLVLKKSSYKKGNSPPEHKKELWRAYLYFNKNDTFFFVGTAIPRHSIR